MTASRFELTSQRQKVSRLPTEQQISILTIIGTGLLERVGTGLLGTIGYVVLPTGVYTDVSRDIV